MSESPFAHSSELPQKNIGVFFKGVRLFNKYSMAYMHMFIHIHIHTCLCVCMHN